MPVPQIQRVMKQIDGDLEDIEYTIDTIRALGD